MKRTDEASGGERCFIRCRGAEGSTDLSRAGLGTGTELHLAGAGGCGGGGGLTGKVGPDGGS